jgi:hypothetical protein
MSDDLDPALRRLFAETAEHPADEAFVAAVAGRTARQGPALRRLAAAALPAAALTAAVVVAGLVLRQGFAVITPLLTASPLGMAAGLALAFAGAVCVGLLAPLAGRRF